MIGGSKVFAHILYGALEKVTPVRRLLEANSTALVGLRDNFFGRFGVDGRADISSFAEDHIESANEFFLGVGLQDVTACAGAESRFHKFRGGVQSQQQNFNFGQDFVDDAGRFEAVEARHGDVHDDDFGTQFAGEADGVLSVGGFSAELPFRVVAEDALDAAADNGVIVDDEDAWHLSFHASIIWLRTA